MKNKWEVINECDDEEGNHTCWSMKINPKEAEYVKFCFEKYLERKNISEVAELCRERGYHGKRGKEPTAWSISVILTRPLYCGYNVYCGVAYKGEHEPIIDVDTYNRVQRILKKQGRLTGRTRKYRVIAIG